MGEFRITDTQKMLLIEALEGKVEVAKSWNGERKRAAEQMVKRHWLTYAGAGWYGRRSYYITNLGRTVARQLGLTERST